VIDSHCHLADEVFAGDLDAVIARAKSAGLERVLVILEAGNGAEAAQARALDASWPEARLAVGVHPHHAHRYANDPARAAAVVREQLAATPAARAVGEIGLDYYYDHSPRDVQKHVFARQMEIAAARRKPIIIHCRPSDNSSNAWDDVLAMLQSHWSRTGLRGILHCFTGEIRHAQAALDLGFLVSFAGNITFPKAQAIRDAALAVPLNRMLIETDAPFLAPVPNRGKRNEPAWVKEVAVMIASLKNLDPAEVAAQTTANFGLALDSPA